MLDLNTPIREDFYQSTLACLTKTSPPIAACLDNFELQKFRVIVHQVSTSNAGRHIVSQFKFPNYVRQNSRFQMICSRTSLPSAGSTSP